MYFPVRQVLCWAAPQRAPADSGGSGGRLNARAAPRSAAVPPTLRSVGVVPADPCHGAGQVVLIPALGREIQQLVPAVDRVQPAAVGGIGMEDLALVIEREHAQAG